MEIKLSFILLTVLSVISGCRDSKTNEKDVSVENFGTTSSVDKAENTHEITKIQLIYEFTNEDFKTIQNLSYLRELDFANCKKINFEGVNFNNLTSLYSLSLCSSGVTDLGLKSIEKAGITELSLGFCENISDSGLKSVGKLVYLDELILAGCDITDKGMKFLEKLTSLKYLDLGLCNKISDEGLEVLGKLTSLEHLDLGGWKARETFWAGWIDTNVPTNRTHVPVMVNGKFTGTWFAADPADPAKK